MENRQATNQTSTIRFHRSNTVIVGSGAAGMNCAVHLCEFMRQKGLENPQERIVVVTRGLALGASRMSGSDKQTYYKMGTSPAVPDSAEEFARTLSNAGCCHGDLALAEAIGSLREFYHLVQAGVPFPTDSMGSFVGYKTDNDPFERATSAGPKTSRFMSECLQRQLEAYGVEIADNQEVAQLLTVGCGQSRRIAGVVTVDRKSLYRVRLRINVYLGANIVLAAGGPGELYETSVYPKGQVGIHGLAFKAGLVGENLTESQFGLASTKFRWNVSGTYMQAIPRIFSTDAGGSDERDFLAGPVRNSDKGNTVPQKANISNGAGYFPSMSKMATNIFLKGYQWPFDPQRLPKIRNSKFEIRNSPPEPAGESSLIDLLVFNEMQKGRRVFLDFLHNPSAGSPKWDVGNDSTETFNIEALEPEAYQYLKRAGALQDTPIDRLFAMNPPAIEIYKQNGIDLYAEPLEIAVCAQHNNGGFAVNKWWESNIPGTFVIGEMAATHGVKRPGGSALNAGQVGGLRAAQYIVNVYGCELPDYSAWEDEITGQLDQLFAKFDKYRAVGSPMPKVMIQRIQKRMTLSAGLMRESKTARRALKEAVELYRLIQKKGLSAQGKRELIWAIQAEHLALTSIAYLKAIVELLRQGSGSRGSHLVIARDGVEIHPDIIVGTTGKVLKFKPENLSLRDSVLRVEYDDSLPDMFRCESAELRAAPSDAKAFEPAWRDFREGKIYRENER
jgi:succinate dehydrogenase/fumarate reductase flavoprotein subunit